MVTPLYLLSLPRSGSTILQKMLLEVEQVDTIGEPHVALPLVGMSQTTRASSWFGYYVYNRFVRSYRDGEEGGEPGDLTELYQKPTENYLNAFYDNLASEGAEYFLDKSPRYCVVADRLVELMPRAKYIFLWRNPLSIIGSLMNSFDGGTFSYGINTVDLKEGFTQLCMASRKLGDKALNVSYEDLVTSPDEVAQGITQFLGIEAIEDVANSLGSTQLRGYFGDPNAYKEQDRKIHKGSKESYLKSINTSFRKKLAMEALSYISDEDLKYMGYERQSLEEELSKCENGSLSANLKDRANYTKYRLANKGHLLHYRGRMIAKEKSEYLMA